MVGLSQVLINTEVVHGSAKWIAVAQNDVGGAWSTLSGALAVVEGMAGNPGKDQAAARFVAAYNPAVAAVWRGIATAHRITGYMSRGLTQTANNHSRADRASVINGRFSMVPAPRQVFLDDLPASHISGPPNHAAPPSAVGPGKKPPHSPLGSLTGVELIDISKYWPTAEGFELLTAARAWTNAHDALIETRGRISAEVRTVTGQGGAPDLEAFGGLWNKLYKPGAANTLYEGLPRLCAGLAKACADYGHAVNDAQLQVNDVAANPVAALAEVVALRAMLAEAARNLLQSVTAITAGSLADHLITSLSVAVVNIPTVRILQATVDGEDFDQVLREWRDLSSGTPKPSDLTSDVDKMADDFGHTPEEVEWAIEDVKGADKWRGVGDNRNPDVVVDTNSGEVYPKMKNGKVGEDSIGNIFDHLGERR